MLEVNPAILLIGLMALPGVVLTILRVSSWRMSRVHQLFLWYLGLSVLSAIAFSVMPNVITSNGWDWWNEYCQPKVFFGLILWFLVSIASTYFAPWPFLAPSFFGAYGATFCFLAFLLMAEAGDLDTLTPQFWIMRIMGVIQGLISLITLGFVLSSKFKSQKK